MDSKLESAAHEGWTAFFALRESTDNPYIIRTREFYSWADGFMTAKQEWSRRFSRTFVNPTI